MFSIFKITCDEATSICDRAQYNEATLFEKLKLNLHIMQCKYCKMYSKQNTFLSKLYKGNSLDCKSRKHSLEEEEKAALKERMKGLM